MPTNIFEKEKYTQIFDIILEMFLQLVFFPGCFNSIKIIFLFVLNELITESSSKLVRLKF